MFNFKFILFSSSVDKSSAINESESKESFLKTPSDMFDIVPHFPMANVSLNSNNFKDNDGFNSAEDFSESNTHNVISSAPFTKLPNFHYNLSNTENSESGEKRVENNTDSNITTHKQLILSVKPEKNFISERTTVIHIPTPPSFVMPNFSTTEVQNSEINLTKIPLSGVTDGELFNNNSANFLTEAESDNGFEHITSNIEMTSKFFKCL